MARSCKLYLLDLANGLDSLVHLLPVIFQWSISFPFHLKSCILQRQVNIMGNNFDLN